MKKKTKVIGLGSITIASGMVLGACDDGNQMNTVSNHMTKVDKAYESCDRWEYNKKDESEKCLDKNSSYHGAYIFGGGYYPNYSSMHNSQDYKDNVDKKTGTLKKDSKYSSKYSGSGKNPKYTSSNLQKGSTTSVGESKYGDAKTKVSSSTYKSKSGTTGSYKSNSSFRSGVGTGGRSGGAS